LFAILGALALPLLALGGFSLLQKQQLGSFSATTNAEASGYGRNFELPIVGFARAGAALIHNGFTPNYYQAHILVDASFTLLFIALAVLLWRRLPLSYVLYGWAMVALVLVTPSHNWYALSSNMRFMLVVFPLFLLLGRWGADPRIERIILYLSLPLLALFTVAFLHGWVA
jgi:predicted lysophospholipase L1 biosynthesis ABC-type transport system permease subunit